MNLLGIQYFADAIAAEISARARRELFQSYVAEALYGLCAFTGNKMSRRYIDILHPVPDDPRTGMEIAVDFLESHGIAVVDDSSQVVNA